MNKPAESTRPPVVQIRFGEVGLAQVRIRTTDADAILEELTVRIAAAPRFFERVAVCLDLGALGRVPSLEEMRAVVEAIHRAGMLSIGLTQSASPAVDLLARELGLPMLAQLRTPSKPPPVVQAAVPAPAPVQEIGVPALMHHNLVRSGQRIYARNRDLVVTATVGAGAEVMADGCVHIYGSLRGRAMAGARGETTARVFCQEFNAELVSIAGVFRVFETVPPEFLGKPVQAWLAGDNLHFARIGG